MNKKENPLSKTTLSFRPTKEEEAFYKEQADKLGVSLAQYLGSMMRKAHESMFNELAKEEVGNEVEEMEDEKEVKKKKFPMTNEEFERTLDKLNTTNLDFLVSTHLKTLKKNYEEQLEEQRKKHKEQLEKERIEIAEQTAKETEERVRKEIEDKNIVIPASPELKEVFRLFADEYKKEGEIINDYEVLIKFFKKEIFWDNEPEIDKELLRKALTKDYLNEPI